MKYLKEFCGRGLIGACGGPVILAVIWLCLKHAGVIAALTVDEAAMGIFSTAVMGFIAAGVSIVYAIESLPKILAGLIQCAVLYLDYLICYILNGWLASDMIWKFTVVFALGFVIIWAAVYLSISARVKKMNSAIGKLK